MGHNSVVSGHLKSTRISQVDGLSTRPGVLGHMTFEDFQNTFLISRSKKS